MTNKATIESKFSVETLDAILSRLSESIKDKTALNDILSEAVASFKSYYSTIGIQQFSPGYLVSGDTPRSEVYNKNLELINADISRFYKEVKTLAGAQLKSFNYAKIVNDELVQRADKLASTVLDLKILSDFTRGDVIVAGDDFRTTDNVDSKVSTASAKAEKMLGAGGMGLKRTENRKITGPETIVEVFPLQPVEQGSSKVNVAATPGNLERFYEGSYYSFVGSARPEGGKFNIKYLLRPQEKEISLEDIRKVNPNANSLEDLTDEERSQVDPEYSYSKDGNTTNEVFDDSARYSNANAGFFVEIGATEEEKQINRLKMFDNDPSTFWECEYVYSTPQPILGNLTESSAVEEDNEENDAKGHEDNLARGATVVIDYKEAEKTAKKYDYENRDLVLDMIISFPEAVPINYVVIDPILFGTSAFIEVLDVATAADEDSQFITVDGWRSLNYARTITPEANEFLNDVQIGQLLAPSRYEYTGKGVFPFPVRVASKVKLRLKVDNPVAAVYERYYVLLRNQLDISTEVKTTVKKGAFRF